MISRFAVPLLIFGLASPLGAQEAQQEGAGQEWKERRNEVELFVGGVTETEESATGFGIGLEYNRRLSARWSLGVEAVEISATDVSRNWLFVFPLYFHVTDAFGLKVGPGVEGSKEEPENGEESETKTQFVVRFGAGYEFELGERFTLTPEVNIDLIDGNATWVYGVSFGYQF